MLGIPPCAMDEVTARDGLDMRLIDIATEARLPIQALEPYDTILQLFADMSIDDQIAMIRTTLPLEPQAADMTDHPGRQLFCRGQPPHVGIHAP